MLSTIHFGLSSKSINRASQSQVLSSNNTPAIQQVVAQDSFQRSKKGVKFTGLSDIVGMDDIKQEVNEQFITPLKRQLNPSAFRKTNIKARHPGGLLLYGEPGCGKTYFARQVIDELKDFAPHVEILPSDRAHHKVGMTEAILKQKFDDAEAMEPKGSIVFIDEFDSLAQKWHPDNSADSSFHTNRRAAMLTHLQEAPKRNITVIGTSNSNPGDLDDAVVRSGRMTIKLKVDRPDYEARYGLFKKAIADLLEDDAVFPIQDKVIKELAEQTDGFTSAQIVSAVDVAANKASARDEDLDIKHIEEALNKITKKDTHVSVSSAASPSSISARELLRHMRYEGIKDQIESIPYYSDLYHGRLRSALDKLPLLKGQDFEGSARRKYFGEGLWKGDEVTAGSARYFHDDTNRYYVSPALLASILPPSKDKKEFIEYLATKEPKYGNSCQNNVTNLMDVHEPMRISPLHGAISVNDADTVERILQWGWGIHPYGVFSSLRQVNAYGKDAIDYALEQGNTKLADRLSDWKNRGEKHRN